MAEVFNNFANNQECDNFIDRESDEDCLQQEINEDVSFFRKYLRNIAFKF